MSSPLGRPIKFMGPSPKLTISKHKKHKTTIVNKRDRSGILIILRYEVKAIMKNHPETQKIETCYEIKKIE